MLLVAAVMELLLAALTDKYHCCQSTCAASHQLEEGSGGRGIQTLVECDSPAPRGALVWIGLLCSDISLWRLCMLQQPFVGMLLSKLSAARSKGITFLPLISQLFLMGMYPDIFINVSSS